MALFGSIACRGHGHWVGSGNRAFALWSFHVNKRTFVLIYDLDLILVRILMFFLAVMARGQSVGGGQKGRSFKRVEFCPFLAPASTRIPALVLVSVFVLFLGPVLPTATHPIVLLFLSLLVIIVVVVIVVLKTRVFALNRTVSDEYIDVCTKVEHGLSVFFLSKLGLIPTALGGTSDG